jgi:uncharacterized protein with PIN domain
MIRKKLTYEYVKDYIEGFGYKLLSTEYINNKTKLKLQCPKGHIYNVRFDSFKKGNRCSTCNNNSKRLTYTEVKGYVEKFGYKLLSKEYKNNHTKLKLQCDNYHIYEGSFNNFQKGARCPDCFGNKKLTYQEIKTYVESIDGYKLLSNTYKNNQTKLKIQCNNGHLYNVDWAHFQSGQRCPECLKHQFNDVKKYIESFDYKLLSNIYINSKIKLKVQCDKGHIYKVTFNNFKRGRRCPKCDIINRSLKYEHIKNYIELINGYTLLSKTYKNIKTKLKIQCNKGHIYNVSFDDFRTKGSRCPECANERLRLKYDDVKIYIENAGYKLLSKVYVNSQTKLSVQCNKGHKYDVEFNSFKGGNRCPYCAEKRSLVSQECFKQIHENLPSDLKVYYYDNIHEFRVNTNVQYKKHSYRMLDFYIPSLNKCIEFNGTYWHGFEYSEAKDLIREIEIKEVLPNIDFWYVDEQDYRDNPDQVIYECLQFLS